MTPPADAMMPLIGEEALYFSESLRRQMFDKATYLLETLGLPYFYFRDAAIAKDMTPTEYNALRIWRWTDTHPYFRPRDKTIIAIIEVLSAVQMQLYRFPWLEPYNDGTIRLDRTITILEARGVDRKLLTTYLEISPAQLNQLLTTPQRVASDRQRTTRYRFRACPWRYLEIIFSNWSEILRQCQTPTPVEKDHSQPARAQTEQTTQMRDSRDKQAFLEAINIGNNRSYVADLRRPPCICTCTGGFSFDLEPDFFGDISRTCPVCAHTIYQKSNPP